MCVQNLYVEQTVELLTILGILQPHEEYALASSPPPPPLPQIACCPPLCACTALHCTALHCTALHCTALHCTALPDAERRVLPSRTNVHEVFTFHLCGYDMGAAVAAAVADLRSREASTRTTPAALACVRAGSS